MYVCVWELFGVCGEEIGKVRAGDCSVHKSNQKRSIREQMKSAFKTHTRIVNLIRVATVKDHNVKGRLSGDNI